ncbi:MAG: surface-adhesin E family protein [Sulfuricella sp.]
MNPVFLFLPALLLLTPAAEAANWHTLPGGAQMTLLADQPQLEPTDKDKKKDKKLKVWDKITYSRLHQAIPGDFYYTSAKSLTEINCTARTLKPLLRIYYDSDGNEVKSIHYRSSEPAEAVVPDTSGEAVFNFACAFKAASAATKTAPRTKSPVQAKASQPLAKPNMSKEKTKEPQKPQTPAGAKPSPPLTPSAPIAKSADTKKTLH